MSSGKKSVRPFVASSNEPVANALDINEQISDLSDKIGKFNRSAGSVKSTSTNGTNTSLASTMNRPSSLWNFNCTEIIPFQKTTASAIPMSSQEPIIIQELFFCLIGVRGNYLTPESTPDNLNAITFKVSDQVHDSLRDIVQEILPLASHYSRVQKFVQETNGPNSGLVRQAFSSALRSVINDYYLSMGQLEATNKKKSLNLHKLLFYIRPTMSTMEVLAELVTSIANAGICGGQVLTLLHDKITSLTGDDNSQKILIHLTQLTAVPYMSILHSWIQKGVILDPQHEFFIEDNTIEQNAELPDHYSTDYWEKRYTICRDKVPRFLEKLSDKILRTGKYLNVIRQCGKNLAPPQGGALLFSHNDQSYIAYINTAYDFAAKALLDALLKENDLMGHLLSVKRYFLLQQGDFITQFMDHCEQELNKNIDDVLPMKLESLLGLTLRLSSANNDPYKDELRVELLPYGLATQMSKIISDDEDFWHPGDGINLSGLECFAFRYEVTWPISLVLNHITIAKYQMLFRHLFFCKHVERQLCRIWKSNGNARKFEPKSAELYRAAFTLRQRMMNAVQNIEYYMMIEVIEPNWHAFVDHVNQVENVDDLLTVHQDFLDICLRNCMLTDPTLLRSIMKLCKVCVNFCEFIQKTERYFVDAELTAMILPSNKSDCSDSDDSDMYSKQTESSLAPSDTFSERVKRFDQDFTGQLIGLLKRVNDVAFENPSDRFINLVHRINFNSFYNDQIELLASASSTDSSKTQLKNEKL